MRAQGKQTILLIPEISLTYQNLRRFYERFGNRVAVVNSRLSAGEKYDSYENARSGRIDIMIGPRSALFTPFTNLGMIIVDEEHESAYNSETSPRYRAVESSDYERSYGRRGGCPWLRHTITRKLHEGIVRRVCPLSDYKPCQSRQCAAGG